MPSSRHRLTLSEPTTDRSTPMDILTPERPVALPDLVDRYLTHHRASGHSPATIKRYTHTFRLFDRFLAA